MPFFGFTHNSVVTYPWYRVDLLLLPTLSDLQYVACFARSCTIYTAPNRTEALWHTRKKQKRPAQIPLNPLCSVSVNTPKTPNGNEYIFQTHTLSIINSLQTASFEKKRIHIFVVFCFVLFTVTRMLVGFNPTHDFLQRLIRNPLLSDAGLVSHEYDHFLAIKSSITSLSP